MFPKKLNQKQTNLLKDNPDYIQVRGYVLNALSVAQAMFCVCGKFATGLHESHCKKFNDTVDFITYKVLYTEKHEDTTACGSLINSIKTKIK